MSRAWRLYTALAAWLCVAAAVAAEGAAGAALAAAATYGVESTVLLNSAERRDGELGYRIAADLSVAPAPQPGGDLLLHFRLTNARLLVRGAHRSAEWAPRGSVWDGGGGGAFAARLRRGAVLAAYLDPGDAPDVLNYKKSLVSLFQFQAEASGVGEHNETDISGECAVVYEPLSDTEFRKIKRRCCGDGSEGVAARRAARYSLDGEGALRALHAEELVTLHAALKARSWHALARRDAAAPAPPPALPPALREAPLTMDLAGEDDGDEDERQLGAAIRLHRVALEGEAAGEGGDADAALALLRLLPALRSASADELTAALSDDDNRDVLPGLCRALGSAGSAAAVRAARDFLQLAARDPLEPLAHAFLAGFALAPSATEEAALDVLRLGEEARVAAVGESALLAAAAAARAEPAAGAVRAALTKGLARCRAADADCRAVRLLALGNLRADVAETLVTHAERDAPRAAAAALSALRAAPNLRAPHLLRLGRLATNASLPLEVRAAALDLVTMRRAADESGAAPRQLATLARALHAERSRAAHELRRVLWQRLASLADAAAVRALPALLPSELRTWDARAHGGTSSVLRRDTGWGGGAGGWRATLDSVQVAAGGLLRRGAVALWAEPPGAAAAAELEVEVWTRGLEAIAGVGADEGGAEGEAEGAAGGLTLAVGGARMRDVTLFTGQAELLGHIWAGSGAAPVAVLRAARPLHEARAALPLLCGAVLRARAAAAAALALDAHATVSLWHRTARAALHLRAGLAGAARASVRTAWGELSARRSLAAEPRLRIAADLDFYDGVALCVRAAVPEHAVRVELRLESVLGARRLRVSRRADELRAAPGRTLALGRANDAACATLRARDDDEDE